MKRLKRIAPIVELANNKEKQAVQQFGKGQLKLDEARKSLNSLRAFRENYSALFNQSANKGLGIRQLHEYRAFLAKLNGAIEEQERVVQAAENELQGAKLAWEAAHRHANGMHKVLEKLQCEAVTKERKHEQNEQDERAGRRGGGSDPMLAVFT